MSLTSYNSLLMMLVVLLIWIPWLWRYKIKPLFAKNRLYRQLKQYPEWRQLVKIEQFLTKLYDHVNGTFVSKKERQRLQIDDDAFIYGEVEFLPFFSVLQHVSPRPGEIFYDLGSGAGKAVFVAASFFPFANVYGVECLPALCDLSNGLLKKAEEISRETSIQLAPIHFVKEDFLKMNFTDGDVIFINATCMSFPSWEKLLDRLLGLKTGSRVIITSKKINHASFELLTEGFSLMSWGVNSVNSYRKIS